MYGLQTKQIASVRDLLGPNTERSNYRATNVTEMNAYIGLLLLARINKSSHEKIESLFLKNVTNRPIFDATMCITRYKVLISCLRFDDANTREERNATDKLLQHQSFFQLFFQTSRNHTLPLNMLRSMRCWFHLGGAAVSKYINIHI